MACAPAKAGWICLRQALPAHQVVNASQSGETTAGGRRACRRAGAAQARYRHSGAGRNDGLRGRRRMICAPIPEQMVAMSAQSKACVLLVGMALPPNYGGVWPGFPDGVSDLAKQRKLLLCRIGGRLCPPTARGRRMAFIPTPARRADAGQCAEGVARDGKN